MRGYGGLDVHRREFPTLRRYYPPVRNEVYKPHTIHPAAHESRLSGLTISKSERVGVDCDIWTHPNADFVPVACRDQFMALKSFDKVDKGVMLYPPSLGKQPERQIISVEDTFDSLRIDISRTEEEIIETPEQIIDSILNNQILNARTRIETDWYVALLEYPVKTINANERDMIYQPDTGPILYPDLSQEPKDLIGGMELAFIAFNTPTWAELILRVPIPIADGLSVYHYARALRIKTHNQIICR